MARVVAVECLVLIEEIALGHETAVDVAVFEIDHVLTFVVDVWDFFSRALAERALEDEEIAVAENHATALEGGVAFRFAVKHTGKLSGCGQQIRSHVWDITCPDGAAK